MEVACFFFGGSCLVIVACLVVATHLVVAAHLVVVASLAVADCIKQPSKLIPTRSSLCMEINRSSVDQACLCLRAHSSGGG